MQYLKTKSASKSVLPRGEELERTVLKTMRTIANVVGGTLGPGGHPVLIERQEHNLPPIITKDGVTVFRSLGFDDSTEHCIMEAARDASVLTASSAGDGTTTATILSEALVRLTNSYCKNNKGASPHQVIRKVHSAFKNILLPELTKISISASLANEDGRNLLRQVAAISANGDTELADAVMKCYESCGDDGNVTIVESSGPRSYEVEEIQGFPVGIGYEDSCTKFYPVFINDQAQQKTIMKDPIFLMNFGKINDLQTIVPALETLQEAWDDGIIKSPNIVIVATGFSESVLGGLATNWAHPKSLNIFPLLVPQSPIPNGQRHFIDDLAAITDSEVFDPVQNPIDGADIDDLGNLEETEEETEDSNGNSRLLFRTSGVTEIQIGRFRTLVIGRANEDRVLERHDEVVAAAAAAESELDAMISKERAAALTGGIAKLKVIGASNGDLKERRDRAEDAVCAVRGAIAHGCLIGGGWSLLRLASKLKEEEEVVREVLQAALLAPIQRLLENAGVPSEEQDTITNNVMHSAVTDTVDTAVVYNAESGQMVRGLKEGILDSFPAVKEAIENSLSIASLLGTLGGTVVFKRDNELEKQEARDMSDWNRSINNG